MRRNWPGSGQVPRSGPDLVGVTDADEVRAAVVYAPGRGQRDAERTGRGPALRTSAVRLLPPLGSRDLTAGAVRRVSGALEPPTVGRPPSFSFGGGDRSESLHDARTRKRLAGLLSQCDPASLFGGAYESA
ncbi:hypothetical protein [Streptomyces sp. NBC_01637]|uniref:hypothetical protein n=1 Tax=unclassified Streptomyces TaxID=2593676 RepID=UPI003869B622